MTRTTGWSTSRGAGDVGGLGVSCGSTSLAALVARRPPLAHLHGHVHSQFGRAGRHFNVAAGAAKRAMLIDLQSMEHEELKG